MIWADLKNFNEFNNGYYRSDGKPLLRNTVAKHAKKLLLGRGCDITTENEQFKEEFIKWSEDKNLIGTLEQVEEICSLYGVAYIMYNLDEEDKTLFIVDPSMPIFPRYVKGKLVAIDFYVYLEHSVMNYWVHEQYEIRDGKCHIRRDAYQDKEGNPQTNFAVFKSQLDYGKEQEETLDIDYIPVFPVWNQNKYLRNPLMARLLSDWFNAFYLECDYLNALEQRTIERMINKSYVIGKATSDTPFGRNCPYTGITASGWINENIRGKEGDTSVEIVSVASKLEDLRKDLDHIKESFFDECGYSYQSTTDQAGSNTATGQMIMKGKDIETTLNKRNIRTIVYNEMFQTIFQRDDFQFIINENISIDENQLLDTFMKANDLGIMSKAEMRSKLMAISIEQAEVDLKEIDKAEKKRLEDLGLTQNEEDPTEQVEQEVEDNGDTAE